MKSIIFAAAAAVTFSACSKPSATAASRAPVAASVAAPAVASMPASPVPTMSDWNAALSKLYVVSSKKDEGDGITSFFASFRVLAASDSKRKSHLIAFGKRDGFRKLDFYSTGIPMDLGTSLENYISLPDGALPVLFLKPYFFSSKGWLFMNHVAVMVDGDVVFEHDFSNQHLDTDQLPGGVEESYSFMATPQDIDALRKVRPDSKVLIRITGKKGYVTVEKMQTRTFISNIVDAIQLFDLMTAALKDHQPPT
ncbi:hypothetical protein [Paraburkholderia sp. JHI869]|uniref:hypothetical protein n=1 Tax=Paraburkholderia sp. JHI869 TaxID=3112959 RepID=UPI0031760705